jgi:hypothetical protein
MYLTMRIAGHLDSHWSEWFEGLEMSRLPDGSTEITGMVIDQAALYGFLRRAQDLGLTMLTISLAEERPDDEEK